MVCSAVRGLVRVVMAWSGVGESLEAAWLLAWSGWSGWSG